MTNLIYSHPAYVINVTEPKDLKVEFVYNFYDKDETSLVAVRGGINTQEIEPAEGEYKNKYKTSFPPRERQHIPRYNRISWNIEYHSILPSAVSNPIRLKDNLVKILKEGSIPFNSFESTALPVNDLPERHFALAQFLKSKISSPDLLSFGMTDKIQSININQPVSPEGEVPKIYKQEELNLTINKKFNFDIFESVLSDPLSPFEDEILSILRNPSEEDNYGDFSVVNDIPNIGVSGTSRSSNALVGFLINKWEVSPDGSLTPHPQIVVKDHSLREIIDIDVLYGKTYYYVVNSVFLSQIPALPDDGSSLEATIQYLKVLVSSRDVKAWVSCEERVPPPPPQDIQFSWRENEGLMVVWNLPYNPQRDIKRIQILRRESINHPFELIREIRFNDNTSSRVVTGIPEDIPDDIVVLTDKPYNIKHIIDEDFNKDSRFIYALCSIDAHFFSSNYSIQQEVSYDRTFNNLNIKFISSLGAPKPYPNLFLEDEGLILNSLKIDGKKSKRAKIIFSPEFLKVFTGGSPDSRIDQLKILKSNAGSYNFQIINLDNQKKFQFTFKVDGSILE